jgi:hypothetical protein
MLRLKDTYAERNLEAAILRENCWAVRIRAAGRAMHSGLLLNVETCPGDNVGGRQRPETKIEDNDRVRSLRLWSSSLIFVFGLRLPPVTL